MLKVKREKMEEYKHHHKSVWPEMLEALSRNGWHNYSLFIQDDGQLFGYFEAEESLSASLEGMSKEDVNRRWQDLMAPFFELTPGSQPDQMPVELEQIFHLD